MSGGIDCELVHQISDAEDAFYDYSHIGFGGTYPTLCPICRGAMTKAEGCQECGHEMPGDWPE